MKPEGGGNLEDIWFSFIFLCTSGTMSAILVQDFEIDAVLLHCMLQSLITVSPPGAENHFLVVIRLQVVL